MVKLGSMKTGTEITQEIIGKPIAIREQILVSEIQQGNIPSFIKNFVSIPIQKNGLKLTLKVSPDYLAVGSDSDYFTVRLGMPSVNKILPQLNCILPTPPIVDAIVKSAKVKLTPTPMKSDSSMVDAKTFAQHDAEVRKQLDKAGYKPGDLVVGRGKDVIQSTKDGRVGIYGWHDANGKPIQSASTVHDQSYVDYSQMIRLVSNEAILEENGETKNVNLTTDIFRNPKYAFLVTNNSPAPTPTRSVAPSFQAPDSSKQKKTEKLPNESLRDFLLRKWKIKK